MSTVSWKLYRRYCLPRLRTNVVFKKVMGQGSDVVMVHGWSMHSGIWDDFAAGLGAKHRVTCLDLPGHGYSPMIDNFSLDGVSRELLANAPQRAVWIGWSLGASVVLQMASAYPERVDRLVLIAGSPKFVRGNGWTCGIQESVLDEMGAALNKECDHVWKRFLFLMTLYADHPIGILKDLRDRLQGPPSCDVRALRTGLDILRNADLRQLMSQLTQSVLIIMGGRDPLIPVEAGDAMRMLGRQRQLRVIDAAGHMPFLSHANETSEAILDFLSTQ